MILNGFWPVFFAGVFGGFLGELLKWYRLREKQELPHYLKSPFYWCVTLFLILAGGALAVCYGTKDINALMAANIGLSAPLIIQSLSGTFGASQTGAELQKASHREHPSFPVGDPGMTSDDPGVFGASQDGGELVVSEQTETANVDANASNCPTRWTLLWRFLAG